MTYWWFCDTSGCTAVRYLVVTQCLAWSFDQRSTILTSECKTTSVFTQNRPMAVVLSSQNSKKRSRSLMWITARPSRQMNCYSSWRTSEWWPPRTRSRTCCRRWTRMVSYREMRKDREWGNRITNIEWSPNFLLFSPAFLSFFRSSIC